MDSRLVCLAGLVMILAAPPAVFEVTALLMGANTPTRRILRGCGFLLMIPVPLSSLVCGRLFWHLGAHDCYGLGEPRFVGAAFLAVLGIQAVCFWWCDRLFKKVGLIRVGRITASMMFLGLAGFWCANIAQLIVTGLGLDLIDVHGLSVNPFLSRVAQLQSGFLPLSFIFALFAYLVVSDGYTFKGSESDGKSENVRDAIGSLTVCLVLGGVFLLVVDTTVGRLNTFQRFFSSTDLTEELVAAIWRGNDNEKRTRFLLSRGADLNAPRSGLLRGTALHDMAHYTHKGLTEAFLAAGADPNAVDDEGMTPLHYAAWIRNEYAVDELVKGKANVNAKDNSGSTPLHVLTGASSGLGMKAEECATCKEIICLLLRAGADINARTMDGQTPLDLAENNGYDAIVAFLRQRGGKSGAEMK
ncbi:MAG: ankyrin repeat domain-containing protein [Planctomycetota bacterium]